MGPQFCTYCGAPLDEEEQAMNRLNPIRSTLTPPLAWAACAACRIDASAKLKVLKRVVDEATDEGR